MGGFSFGFGHIFGIPNILNWHKIQIIQTHDDTIVWTQLKIAVLSATHQQPFVYFILHTVVSNEA